MVNDYIEDFFECIYNAEIEQKQKLDSADSFLVGLLAGLMGVGAYYLQILSQSQFGLAVCLLWLFVVPFYAMLILGLTDMSRSIWPREKEYISTPQEWSKFVDGYDTYYAYYHKEPERGKRVAVELAKLRRQQYIQAGQVNRLLIYKKHAFQTRAKRYIVRAGFIMLGSAIPLYFVQVGNVNAHTSSSADPAISIDVNEASRTAAQADTSRATRAANGRQVVGRRMGSKKIVGKEN